VVRQEGREPISSMDIINNYFYTIFQDQPTRERALSAVQRLDHAGIFDSSACWHRRNHLGT
jgi:hypothetical protein